MEFENRTPDEHVNYSTEHPLKEFAWLLGGLMVALVALSFLVGAFAGEVASWLPYRYEAAVAEQVDMQLKGNAPDAPNEPAAPGEPTPAAIRKALDRIAQPLAAHMRLPEGMQIKAHYNNSEMVNAFATLGGNIVIMRGLIEAVPDENTLAMVIAHEIAHAAERHPVKHLGRAVGIGIVLSVVSAEAARTAAATATNLAATGTLLTFSRQQEREADTIGLDALVKQYGHAGGATALFPLLEASHPPEHRARLTILSTHPHAADRVTELNTLVAARGWQADGMRIPLSPTLAALQQRARKR